MPLTRLSQSAIGERAYSEDGGFNVPCTLAHWGWQPQAATVEYEKRPTTRLGQLGIGVANYPVEDEYEPINVVTGTGNWGWQGFDVTLPAENVLTTTGNWGWVPQEPVLCSQFDLGYPYSFNGRVWPTCVFNDHVFGVRAAVDLDLLQTQPWGWQAFDVTVSFSDPVEVVTGTGDWGWFGVPVGISSGYDVQTTIGTWGWNFERAIVTMPIDSTIGPPAHWGWFGYPAGVSFQTDIQCTVGTWGWQAQPVTVDAPTFDIVARWGNWGWQGFPPTVRQTALLPGDIEAIAEAVYQKMISEGAVQQWFEVWQRMGLDPAHPQTIRHPQHGGNIEVGGITIEQAEHNRDVTQHRQ